MKKLYFLNEEEKNRILNLHENATKRQYLSEQETSPFGNVPSIDDINPLSAKNLIPGLKRDDNWKTTYSCVPSQGVKPTKLSDGSTAYQIKGYVYYNNGFKRKMPVANNKSEKYSCDTEKFNGVSSSNVVSAEDKAKKVQQYKQQIVTKTNDTTKQIQKLLGLPETGVMDSVLLQKINDKLNGKSQETPKSDVTTQPRVEPLQQLTPAGVNTQQIKTMAPEQLTAGLQQMQQKAAAVTAGLKR